MLLTSTTMHLSDYEVIHQDIQIRSIDIECHIIKKVGKCTGCFLLIENWLLVCYSYNYVCAVAGSGSSQSTIPFSICVSWYTGAVKRRMRQGELVLTCTNQSVRLEPDPCTGGGRVCEGLVLRLVCMVCSSCLCTMCEGFQSLWFLRHKTPHHKCIQDCRTEQYSATFLHLDCHFDKC